MVTLNAITAADCVNCIGGIVKSGAIDCGHVDLAASTVNASGQITALALTLEGVTAGAKELIYTDNKTAKFDSVGERNGDRHVNNQDATMEFNCIDNDKILAGELLKDACCLVVVHEYADGFTAVQGIDAVPDGVGKKLVYSLEKAKATVSALSGTTADASKLTAQILSVSRNVLTPMADPATFGLAEFLAL